jgi:hypothetical protein
LIVETQELTEKECRVMSRKREKRRRKDLNVLDGKIFETRIPQHPLARYYWKWKLRF